MENNYKLNAELAQLTGYITGMAKCDERMPRSTRINIIRRFMSFWNEIDPESTVVQGWIKGWNDEIDRISKI